MIQRTGRNVGDSPTFTSDEMSRIFKEGIEDALAESRRMGVPIPREMDGVGCFELPDGTIVPEDPWHGETTAPAGWYERFNIDPPQRPGR